MSKKDNSLEISRAQEDILYTLLHKERYGLEILEAIERSGGRIGFSSLYPNLKKLEERRLVESWWDEKPPDEHTGARRRYFKITGAGREALKMRESFLTAVSRWEPSLGG